MTPKLIHIETTKGTNPAGKRCYQTSFSCGYAADGWCQSPGFDNGDEEGENWAIQAHLALINDMVWMLTFPDHWKKARKELQSTCEIK